MRNDVSVPPPTDFDLVKRVAKGDADACTELHRRHNQYLYAGCMHIVRKPDVAEDMVQETWQTIWQKAKTFQGASSFTTWAYKIMKNQTLMRIRREKARPEGRVNDNDGECPIVVSPGSRNHKRMSIIDKIGLQKALEQLLPGYRVTFLLKAGMGYEHEEIGELLGVNAGTSKSQYFKARKALNELWEEGVRASAHKN